MGPMGQESFHRDRPRHIPAAYGLGMLDRRGLFDDPIERGCGQHVYRTTLAKFRIDFAAHRDGDSASSCVNRRSLARNGVARSGSCDEIGRAPDWYTVCSLFLRELAMNLIRILGVAEVLLLSRLLIWVASSEQRARYWCQPACVHYEYGHEDRTRNPLARVEGKRFC